MILISTSTHSLPFRFRLSLALLSASTVLAQSTVSPRWGQAATVVGNTLYIHGGKIDQNNAYSYNSAPNTEELLALNFGKSFDLSSTPWTTLNATGGPLVAFHTITAYSTSQALVFGGDAGTSVPLPTRNDSTWQLTINDASASWTSRAEGWADQPMRRQYHSSIVYKDIVYIMGGEKVDGSGLAFSQPYTFNPSGPTFTAIPAANGPPGLVGHATLALSDGRIIVLGGLSRSANALSPLDTVYIYDIARSSWSTLTIAGSPTPVPRRNFAATVIDADRILIHGGADASLQTALSDGAMLDLKKLQWSAVPALNQTLGSRFDHTAVTVGTSVFFFFGFDGARAVQNIVQLLDLTSTTFLNTFAPNLSTNPNTNTPPNPSHGPSNDNGSNGGGNNAPGSTDGSSNSNNGNNSGTNNPTDPPPSQPADKQSSSSLPIILGSVLGVLGLAAAAAIIIIVTRKRRKVHQRNWSSLSEEPEKLIMVGGFGAAQREGIVTRLMNIGKPSNMVPVRERFDILADEDTYEARRWRPRRSGTAGSSSIGRHGRSREPSTFTSVVNASVTSFRSAFGRGTAPPRLPQSADHTVSMNPFTDTYTAVAPSQHSRRRTSFSSYRDPFGDDNVIPEDEYERAMALQNAGIRPRPVRQSSSGSGTSILGLGGVPYVPLQPIQSITTDSHGSSQGHNNVPSKESEAVGMAVASAGEPVQSHEGKPKLLTKSPPHSPRRGTITFSTSPPNSPTFGPTNVNRSLSAGGRIGAGLARTVTVISSIFGNEHRGERGFNQGVDFRDPNPPPPRLGAIEEAPTPNLEKGKGRVASLRGGEQQGVYGPGAVSHGRSLSSLKTANSEALERLGGKWEVVQRVDTNDTAASVPLLGEEPAHTVRSYSSGIPMTESPVQDREQTRPPWKPLALRSPSSSTTGSRTVQPPMPPPPMPPPKSSVSTGVAARIQAFEKRTSVDLSSKSPILIPPSSPVAQPKKRTYGLVPKPTLFVANPGRDTSTDS